jgi:hypothetical protein
MTRGSPKRRHALRALEGGALEAIERVLRQDAVVTEPLDFEAFAIDLLSEVAKEREVVDGLGDVEVLGVVDRRLGAERALLLEVLLDVGVFVFDMQARLHPVGDHAGTIAVGRRRRGAREAKRKEQSHAVGPPEIEILADDGFEEVAALDRAIEDLREADFDLVQRKPMRIGGGPIAWRDRPRQPMAPAIEEGVDVGGAERITRRVQRRGVGTREEAVVETHEANALPPQLLLHPLMAVETRLDRVRQIGADCDERRAPLPILDVEVVLRGSHPLAREVERDAALRPSTLLRFERPLLLLGEAEHHDALAFGEAGAMGRGDGVFVLAGLEFHDGNGVGGGKLLDRRGEAVVHRFEQGGRGNRMAEMIAQEVTEAAGRLQLGHIRVQIEPVEAAHFERDMVTDNVGDVGRHRNLLAEIPAMVLLGRHRCSHRSQHLAVA